MDRVGLTYISHASPYKLQWFEDSKKISVTKQVQVPFSIENHKDEILCNVVPMQA